MRGQGIFPGAGNVTERKMIKAMLHIFSETPLP